MSEQHKLAAAKRGAAKTAKIHQQVKDAIRTISNEMQDNGGIYPQNGGAVSMAEIARRAEINESTFYKKNNAALKERVSLWLNTLKKKETVGRMRVRKTFQQRAESWHVKYKALETKHVITELQYQELQSQHEDLQRKYDSLLEKNCIDAESKVIALPKVRQ